MDMIPEDKYFYIKELASFRSGSSILMKWNPTFSVEVNEEVDYSQGISFSIGKLGQKDTKPTGSKYTKVTSVIKETFFDHYKLATKYIHETIIDDGEFFLYQHSKDWFEVQYFSKDEKDKKAIQIDFRDGVEYLWLTVRSSPGHKNRPQFRKKAEAITAERFKQFLNLTIQFFYDPDSMATFLLDYIKNFRLLCKGDSQIEGLIISVSKSFEEILVQLKLRQEFIEKRLIENDKDTPIDRANLRGELTGINYAITVINLNK